MTTAILIPTLNRPFRIEITLQSLAAATPEPYRVHWCASDPDSLATLSRLGEFVLDDSDSEDRRYVTRMNKLVRVLDPDVDTMFFASDDIRFHPGWLKEALRVLGQGWQEVVVNDLRNANGTQGLIRREYLDLAVFDAPGDAFHGGYLHNFADTEQFFTATKRGVITRALASFVEHLHPLFTNREAIAWDKTYTNAMAGWDQDNARFNERVARINELL